MKFIRKNIMKITFFVVFIFITSIIVIKNNLKDNEVYASSNSDIIIENTIKKEEKEENKEIKTYYVDIKGEVLNPGVYEVEEDTRVIDVINMAGGLLDNSDTSKINLSKKVKDEMVIIIYNKEDLKQNQCSQEVVNTGSNNTNNIDYSFNDALIEKEDLLVKDDNFIPEIKEENKDTTDSTSSTNGLININTASKEELMSLTGIGESKAIAIIKYREENGLFNSIEDILNVSGIGESVYEKIKNNITT